MSAAATDRRVFATGADGFVDSLKIACAAAATKENRPALECVRIFRDGDEIVVVATDSFVLWEERFPAGDAPEEFDVLIPAKDLKKTLSKAAKLPLFIIEIGQDRIIVNDEAIIPTVDTQFPEYEKLLRSTPSGPHSHVSLGEAVLPFLATVAKTLGVPVRLYSDPEDYTKPIAVETRSGARCVVMPVKHP